MFYYLFLLYLSINSISTQQNQCILLNNKLTKYNLKQNFHQISNTPGIRLCQGLINDRCCPQIYEDRIQNATAIELYQLFELYTINLYEPLLRLTNDLNNTFIKLIEYSRNETHLVLQRGYHKLYQSYQLSIDKFFNNLLTLTYRTYQHDIRTYVDQLFRNILHISLTLDDKKDIKPTYFSCLWKNQPFGNHPNLLEKQLDVNLGKLFHLNELFQLSHELVQVLSTSVTTDYHCIDSYMQLSYCNLCSGRHELPCLNNCMNIIESCLVNITLIDDVWRNFIDAIENIDYFNNIEKVLSSIGLSISDAVMTFFNSGGVQNKDVIDQCGHIRVRREAYTIDQKSNDEYSKTVPLSLLDRQLIHMSRSLHTYRSFWMKLPQQICHSTGISALNGTTCWTGSSISRDGGSSVRSQYDKPLSLRLQRILKEMKQKSEMIGSIRRTTSVLNMKSIATTDSSLINQSRANLIIQNLTDTLKTNELDDYPNDNEFDYSDYAYEDSTDETTTSSTTTTVRSTMKLITTTTTTVATTTTTRRAPLTTISTTHIDDDLSVDDTNTAYYDYGDHELYNDNELEEISTTEEPFLITTTRRIITTTTTPFNWKDRIPFYHRRPPVIWNVNINDNDEQQSEKHEQRRNSGSSLHYSLLLLLIMYISRV
ncbi:unnamed protein product [Adineta steineri]|uniref:Glypican-like protein n=1 Tax=Adineta steineri TaxID=433720 RepID=A0A818J8R2_9BILA|nr:unnamed protein product [Adineta steineri]